MTKKAPGMLKRDRRRWFTLHEDGAILYYTGPDLDDMKGSLNVARLVPDDIKLDPDSSGGMFGYTIRTPQRLWQFYCETESQRKAWRKNIIAVINSLSDVPVSGK